MRISLQNYNFPGKASENILTMRSYADDLRKQLLRSSSLNFHEKTQVRIVGSLCGLKMKMLLCQPRYISEEYNLQIDVRVFSSTLLAYALNSLLLCLAFIESWILRCRTKFLLSMCMKVAREQPCWQPGCFLVHCANDTVSVMVPCAQRYNFQRAEVIFIIIFLNEERAKECK